MLLLVVVAVFLIGCILLLLGATYLESSKAEFPPGIDNPAALRRIHQSTVALSILGTTLEKLGLCSMLGLMRLSLKYQRKKLGDDPELHIKNMQLDGVLARVYRPAAPSAGSRKGVIFFHGGGFMMGSIESYDYICRHIAKKSGAVVASIEYRLAPEHRYPAAFEDCLTASIHFLKTAEQHGVDPSSVILCGDSAGGTLTAGVTQVLVTMKDIPKPLAQAMIYPSLQMIDYNLPSYQHNSRMPLLFREHTLIYQTLYLGVEVSNPEDALNGCHVPPDLRKKFSKWLSADNIPDEFKVRGYKPHTMSSFNRDLYQKLQHAFDPPNSPLVAEDSVISQLPKAYILTCEFDVFKDDGILYKKRLEDNGVPVTWHHVKRGFHGVLSFFDNPNFNSGIEAANSLIDFIKNA